MEYATTSKDFRRNKKDTKKGRRKVRADTYIEKGALQIARGCGFWTVGWTMKPEAEMSF